MLYGLYEYGQSLSEIAKKLKVTPSAICQRRNALKGDLVARFGELVFHDQARFVRKRMRKRAAKKKLKKRCDVDS